MGCRRRYGHGCSRDAFRVLAHMGSLYSDAADARGQLLQVGAMETQSAAAILLKSFRLINSPAAHCHFLDLSVVFLLPLSFFLSSILFPSLLDLLLLTLTDRFPNFQISTSEAQQNQPPQSPPKPFFLSQVCPLRPSLLSLRRRINHPQRLPWIPLPPAELPLRRPIWYLFLVASVGYPFSFPVRCSIENFCTVLVHGCWSADLLGFPVDYSSPFFTGFVAVVVVALLMVLLYLQVFWTLAPVVVVLESTWGFNSLIRSARPVKGAGRSRYL